MTGTFRANNPLNTFLLFVYGMLLKLVWFIHPQVPVAQSSNGFLFNDMLNAIKPVLNESPIVYSFITYLLLFTQAVSFNQLLTSRRLMQKPNYLPGMSYLLVTSFFGEWNVLSAPLLVNSLLIWVWAKMSNLYNTRNVKATLFNIGIAVGICAFFYFPSLVFGVLIIFALLITRAPKVAEWLIAIMGVLTPWYFLFAWLFITDKLYRFHVTGFKISQPLFAQDTFGYIGMILLLLVTIIGGILVQNFAAKQVVQVRKGWALMMIYLIVALSIPFINVNHNFEYWILAAVPVSAFIGSAFYYPKNKYIPLILHWIMVGFVIYREYLK